MDLESITTRKVDPADRVQLAASIVSAFWGSRHGFDDDVLEHCESRLSYRLPAILRLSYRSLFASKGINNQDGFVAPEHLVVSDGHLVFRHENQGCASWSVRIDDQASDPRVWIRIEGSGWRDAGGPVSSFIVHSALSEAIHAPRHCANAPVDVNEIDTLRAGFKQLDVDRFLFWPSPDELCSFYAAPDTLIVDHAGSWLWAACLSEQELNVTKTAIAADWQVG